jgi:tRNA(Ile)-lysidine synthase
VVPTLIGGAEFRQLIERLGPWPARPALAVALSGGRDSVALTLLLQDWLGALGGRLLALTVDHGLRAGSAEEAAWAAAFCAKRGIPHRTLVWPAAERPPAGVPVQSAAREARYRLLEEACRRAGVFALCTAHQADDQRETLLLRLAAGSGPLGLAAMSARRPLDRAVLLRPLLGLARSRLEATLKARDQTWLDDPSNEEPRHRRVALRQAAPALAAAGLGPERLAEAAELFGRLRSCLERAAAALLAEAVAWHPAGFASLSVPPLLTAPQPVARLALSEVLRAFSPGAPPPGERALGRALARLTGQPARGFTLAGVRLWPRRDTWLALPEARRLLPLPLEPGQVFRWGAFAGTVSASAPSGLRLQCLDQRLWPGISGMLVPNALPGPVLWVQPVLHDAVGLLALPTLGWQRGGSGPGEPAQLRFIPEAPAGAFGFTVAYGQRHII